MKKIYESLRGSCFTPADFDTEFPDSGSTLLIIKFKHIEGYQLQMLERKEKDETTIQPSFASSISPKRIETRTVICRYLIESPGDFKEWEEIEVDTFEDILDRIPVWCRNIKNDIGVDVNTEDEFNHLRDQLDKMLKESIKDENERFSQVEIKRLNDKFDSLFQKFSKLQEENKITEAALSKISLQIDELKKSAKTYPKGVWARISNNRLIDIMATFAKSTEGRSLIIGGIKNLLGK